MRALLATAAAIGVLLGSAPAVVLAQTPAQTKSAQRALRRALRRDMRRVGGASSAYVFDLTSAKPLFSAAAATPRLPASVEKLYTTSTALLMFGPRATLTTSLYGVGSLDATGTWQGAIFLKGDGDPTFGAASFDGSAYGMGATMEQLVANLLAKTPIKALNGRVIGDESYFDSLRGTPASGYGASFYTEGLLSALAYDRGFTSLQETTFQPRPALFATQQLVAALKAAGVHVPAKMPVYTGRTRTGAQLLATVRSPPMATLIALTNAPSDNFFAEMLLKGIGARFGGAGTTAAGVSVVRNELASHFGIQPALDDGSGLSRDDLTSPRDVVSVLQQMDANSAFVNSLAIAGETGTLAYEMQGTAAQGRCSGKTGTLSDVGNLAGYCTARDGHTLAFAFLMNAVDPNAAHATEGRMAVSLAKYNG